MSVHRPNHLLVVIHMLSLSQAMRNVAIAYDKRASGVFLINHCPTADGVQELVDAREEIRPHYPTGWFIGFNFLGLANEVAIATAARLYASGVWSDDAGLVEQADGSVDIQAAERTQKACQSIDRHGSLYFGGVAFKYRQRVRYPGKAAKAALPFVDVVTTSGNATGQPPTLEKIREIREAIGDFPLAVASGITPENVSPYLPYVDYFLVATGISASFHELNPERVSQLARMMR